MTRTMLSESLFLWTVFRPSSSPTQPPAQPPDGPQYTILPHAHWKCIYGTELDGEVRVKETDERDLMYDPCRNLWDGHGKVRKEGFVHGTVDGVHKGVKQRKDTDPGSPEVFRGWGIGTHLTPRGERHGEYTGEPILFDTQRNFFRICVRNGSVSRGSLSNTWVSGYCVSFYFFGTLRGTVMLRAVSLLVTFRTRRSNIISEVFGFRNRIPSRWDRSTE